MTAFITHSLAIHHALPGCLVKCGLHQGKHYVLDLCSAQPDLILMNPLVLGRCALPRPSQLRPRSVRMVAERLLG